MCLLGIECASENASLSIALANDVLGIQVGQCVARVRGALTNIGEVYLPVHCIWEQSRNGQLPVNILGQRVPYQPSAQG